MDWCVNIFVGWVAVSWLFCLFITIRDELHRRACHPCRRARDFLREQHPTWKELGSSHRATELERCVVAVFYQAPRTIVEPCRYLLIVVYDDGRVNELPDDDQSPYRILGRK